MGFGLLFIGYFIAFLGSFVESISILTYVLGAGIILFSLRQLIFENKMFIVSAILAFALEVVAIILAIMTFTGASDDNLAYLIISQIYHWVVYLLNASLMVAITIISSEVKVLRIKVMSIINASIIGISTILSIIYECINNEGVELRLAIVATVFQIISIVLGLIIIFNCYMKICYEDDVGMERTSSGIPLFDFLNEKLDKVFNKNKKNLDKDTLKKKTEKNKKGKGEKK